MSEQQISDPVQVSPERQFLFDKLSTWDREHTPYGYRHPYPQRRTTMTNRKEMSSMGGKARAAKMTPEQRSESARHAVNTRWARLRARNRSWTAVVTGSSYTLLWP